jgi:hypothetical protein
MRKNFRVHFVIIGAQKCGTTTMASQLAEHPAICFCLKKEPGYFNRAEDWRSELNRYHALYSYIRSPTIATERRS